TEHEQAGGLVDSTEGLHHARTGNTLPEEDHIRLEHAPAVEAVDDPKPLHELVRQVRVSVRRGGCRPGRKVRVRRLQTMLELQPAPSIPTPETHGLRQRSV